MNCDELQIRYILAWIWVDIAYIQLYFAICNSAQSHQSKMEIKIKRKVRKICLKNGGQVFPRLILDLRQQFHFDARA